jgi:cephalosporin hydroxylase
MNLINIIKTAYNQKILREYPDPVINQNSTEFEVNNWIISDFVIRELIPFVGIYPFPVNEQFLLTAIVCRFKPDHVFEWGTNVGKSARIFHEIRNHFKIPFQIHSIDLPDNIDHEEHPHNQRGMYIHGLTNLILYQGDGLDTSLEICRKNQKIRNPLFFLDGDHSYLSVKRELNGIIRQVKNPIFIIHDTFYQSPEAHYNIGPYSAIKEFLVTSNENYDMLSTNTGLPGLIVLFKKTHLKN